MKWVRNKQADGHTEGKGKKERAESGSGRFTQYKQLHAGKM